jgi:anthranilate phosphoribosyltransferase
MKFNEALEKINAGQDLSRHESKQAVFAMMDGTWDASQIGTLLIELHRKGETSAEIVGFAEAMREKAVRVSIPGQRLLDTCGTGGDKKNTFNISTIAAFVLAGCGIPVVKHGNRAASSTCGSADLLHEMKISCRIKAEQVESALEVASFAFLFAPDYHPATKSVVAVRKQIGTPTIFNLLGPLTNPASPAAQVIGVYDLQAVPLMREAVRMLDAEKRAFFIHSSNGYDEATPTAEFILHSTFAPPVTERPQTYGFADCSAEELTGGSPEANASIAFAILNGEQGARRDTVLLNALLGYVAYHPDATPERARDAVTESIDSRSALRVVRRLQEHFPSS